MNDRQQLVGDYYIVHTLGVGTTGKVKLGVHKDSGVQVAIKIIKKFDFLENPQMQVKIQREIALMRIVDHPRLLKLIEVFESSNHLYIVLEYASNGELFEYLVSKHRLGVEEALNFFRQIIYGIEYLHNLGICHRDLKPENILLDANYNIKIADFGFARFVKDDIADTSCGSPHYAAPEVIRGHPYDGKRADIWSCGVILYALLAGHLPFDNPSIRILLNKVKSGKYLMPDFPDIVKDLVSHLLDLNTKTRYCINEIKQHECFRIGLPPDYILPRPLPFPSFTAPVLFSSLDDHKLEIFHQIGYLNDDELVIDLESTSFTKAKAFYYLLTIRLDIMNIPWEMAVNHTENNENENGGEILIDAPKHAYAVIGDDVFHRKRKFTDNGTESFGQSLVQSMEWTVPNSISTNEKTSIVVNNIPLIPLVAFIQQFLLSNYIDTFFPDDVSIIGRHFETQTYFSLYFIENKDDFTQLIKMDMAKGSRDAFIVLRNQIEEAILQSFS